MTVPMPEQMHEENTKRVSQRRKRTPTVYQMEVNECGAASLSMIMQYYGKYVPLEELRIETGVSRNGCNAKNIYLAAERYGMEVKASRRDLDRMIAKSEVPCMLHWNYSHFVVYEGKQFGKYCINDPQRGMCSSKSSIVYSLRSLNSCTLPSFQFWIGR